ncbi:MAG: tetratricopeptide repeat protein [Verrucomicrobia bacterium]|nr:tetratricopeptide repeat protein [Verrucomicrobiota bacterium]
MLLTALKVKLAAMVAVAGLDTAEMPGTSAELNKVLEALASDQAAAQKAAQDKTTGPDVNKSFNDALAKVNELAKAGDKDAQYALAHWGVLSNSNVNEAVDLYRKAAAQGQVLAKVELAQVLLQAAPQDQEKAKEAVKLIEEAEAADNKVARRLLANLYVSGAPNVGINQSVEKAKTLLEKGSVAGDGESTLGLSQLYAAGVPGLAVDAQKSLDYLIKATEQKNAVAMSTYAARLFDGDTATETTKALVTKDPAAAMKMFEDAAATGFAAANRLLGAIYENGLGGNTKSIKKAVDYYTKAANANDGEALFRLGNFFEAGIKEGEGEKAEVVVQQNAKSALDLYRLAAQNGQASAFYNVGVYYETGTVVDKDPIKAFAFLLKAATSGVPQAQFRLAGLYQQGTGTSQDIVAAMAWFDRAASGGFAPAQIALGQMFETGAGLGRANPAAAALQYEAASEAGVPLAMLRLASLNERGLANIKDNKAVPNMARALAYADLAVDASQKAEVAVKYRDELKAKMKAEDVTEAKKIYDSKKKADPAAPAAATDAPAAKSKGSSKSK